MYTQSPRDRLARIAATRSSSLPLVEAFALIDKGFSTEIGQYNASRWVDAMHEPEELYQKFARYVQMNGPEEFQRILTMICYLRLSSPVCSNCAVTTNTLLLCTKCKLTFYCSATCQLTHWPTHRQWCGKRFSLYRDSGPASLVLVDQVSQSTIPL